MTTRICLILCGLALCQFPMVRAQQKNDLADVLRRAGTYVEQFQHQLSSIVAEETYLQEVVPFLGMNARGREKFQQRRLRSDLLLLRPEGAVTWVQFRDVFDVDGQAVPDRGERLETLFLKGGVSSAARVQQLRAESARYNIGDIARTMNVPVLPLAVLALPSQRRFRFTVAGTSESGGAGTRDNSLPGTANFTVKSEVWIVRFQERLGPTLVQTQNRGNIFSHGRFWIEPDTGRVLMSEMITENQQVRGELLVSYQSNPLLGFLVPIELRERYTQEGYPATISGEATYGNFRRFQVDVNEAIGPIQ